METFKELLVRSVEQFGSGTAFTLKEGKDRYTDISFIRFYEEVKSLATAFISRGFSGERIAVTGKNSYHWREYLGRIVSAAAVLHKEILFLSCPRKFADCQPVP